MPSTAVTSTAPTPTRALQLLPPETLTRRALRPAPSRPAPPQQPAPRQAPRTAGRRQRVEAFAEPFFDYLPRADQRRWACAYVAALVLTEGKKSMRRLAESLSASPTAQHSLQQFINGSPWRWEPARRQLASWIARHSSVRAFTVTPVTVVKRGRQAVGVHRSFVPALGRTVNCQESLALSLSCPGANFPVDWRLVLPREWLADDELRRRARIPDTQVFQPRWQHALTLLAQARAASCPPDVPFVADLGDAPDLDAVTDALERLGCDFVVMVNPRTLPVPPGVAAAGLPAARTAPPGLRPPAAGRGAAPPGWSRHTATVTGADGTFRTTQLLSAQVWRRVPRLRAVDDDHRVYRVFTELTPGGRGPRPKRPAGPLWLTNMVDHRLDELLEYTRLYVSSTVTVDCLDTRFDLLDFAGRSYPAWHHHMTMASAAYAFLRLCPR